MYPGVGGLGDPVDTVTGDGIGHPPPPSILQTLEFSNDVAHTKLMESLDDIYRLLEEKTNPKRMKAQLMMKGTCGLFASIMR